MCLREDREEEGGEGRGGRIYDTYNMIIMSF